MPVYNMITGLNAPAGSGASAIEDFGLVYHVNDADSSLGASVYDGAFLKEACLETIDSGSDIGVSAKAVVPLALSPPFCVSIRSTRMQTTSPGAVTDGNDPMVGFSGSDLSGFRVNGVQLSADKTQIRTVLEDRTEGDWFDVPSGWRDGEPNTLEFMVGADHQCTVFFNGAEVAGMVLPLSAASIQYFGLCLTRTRPEISLSMGQIVVSGAPLLAYDIPVLRPSADRTSVGFAPDTGTEMFSRINETVPDGDTSYVSASYGGDNALFRYTDADGNALELDPAQTVKAIKHTTQAKLDEAGNRDLASVYQDGGNAEVTAGSVGVTGEYALRSQIIEVNPLTGVAWQPDDFADWSFGFQIVEE